MLGSGLTVDEIALVQGAADIDMVWMQEMPQQETILARGELRGRLESAERALRNSTAHSVEVAAARLPKGQIPVVAVATGTKVVPVAAMKSGPSGKPLPVAVREQPATFVLSRSDGTPMLVTPNARN
jgi:hypothetical protein